MKTFFLLVIILTTSLSSAQNILHNELLSGQQTKQDKNHFLIKDSNIVKRNQDTTKKKFANDLDNYESRFSTGIGILYVSGDLYPFNTLFSSSLHINLHPITKYLYFALGADIYIPSDPSLEVVHILINIMPSFRLNFFRNKFSIFFGAGICGTTLIIGSIISFRAEYNVHEILSLGFEIKHPNFGENYKNRSFLMNHFYLAFKF